MAAAVVIDIETRSRVDLKKAGARRYAADPSTDVSCIAYAIDDYEVELWLPSEPVPPAIVAAAADSGTIFVAHNAGFERAVFELILEPRYGWPAIPIERWRCTMAASLALALPAKLKTVAQVLELENQKADDGIMHLMSKPRRPRKGEDPAGIYWFDDSARLQEYCAYCRRDVACERELACWLPPLSDAEQALWCLDQRINDRGFYADGALIEAAIGVTEAAERAVQAELRQITGGEIGTINQTVKLKAYLAARGCELRNMEKGTLSQALRRIDLSDEARRVIELRREAAHASAGKMQALKAWRAVDGRVRGAFRYHGAATGRWVGLGVQPQNFRRESEDTEAKVAAVMSRDLTTVRQLGAPIEVTGDVARASICAPPGSRLLIGDFSGIESRVLAWVADERRKLEQWAKFDQTGAPENDPYVVNGISFGFPQAEARKFGKIGDLAFGFQGGAGAYKNFAFEDDATSDAQIEGFKLAWRARHPNIEQFWYGIDRAAIEAVKRAPEPIRYGRLTLQVKSLDEASFLLITLPSGRRLSYPCPGIITSRFGKPAVEFADNAAGKWSPCNFGKGSYGGIWTENVVSGIARDLLAAAMERVEAGGYPVVLHIHDEIVCELPDGAGSLEEFKALIEQLPDWAKGLPVAAKVRNGPRFADAELAVTHVPGSMEPPPVKLRARRAEPGELDPDDESDDLEELDDLDDLDPDDLEEPIAPEPRIKSKKAKANRNGSTKAPAPSAPEPVEPKPEPIEPDPKKPEPYQIDFANEALPPVLTALTREARWVCWRFEWRKGKWTKPPIQTGHGFSGYARSNDASTWGTYDEAVRRVIAGEADGITFCIKGSNIAAVDLDDCRDRETGVIATWARDIIRRAPAGTYCEVTVSGTGLRLIGLGGGYEIHRKFPAPDGKGSFELYRNTSRCITVSGKMLDG
jgi:DNA polymerase